MPKNGPISLKSKRVFFLRTGYLVPHIANWHAVFAKQLQISEVCRNGSHMLQGPGEWFLRIFDQRKGRFQGKHTKIYHSIIEYHV